jgi:GT2 family glycosyltransferase/ADP-heptose:LPS heptosyltransferase
LRVSFVIPTYKDNSLIVTCLKTLRKFHKDNEVIVVDDGSPQDIQDGLVPICEKYNAILLTNFWNNGFGHTVNRGINRASGDVVVLVNNDIEFTQSITGEITDKMNKDPLIAIMGFLLYYPNGNVQHGGHRRRAGTNEFGHWDHNHRSKQARVCYNNWYNAGVTGALMAIRKSFTDKIGAFKSGYVLAYEDVEICLRAWHTGWRVYYSSKVSAIHAEGATRGATNEQKIALGTYDKERKSGDQYFKDVLTYNLDSIEKEVNSLNTKLQGSYSGIIGIKRTGAIGDCILTTGIVRHVKERNPMAEVVVYTKTKIPDIYHGTRTFDDLNVFNDYCDKVYDLDLAYEMRPSKNRLASMAEVVFGKNYRAEDVLPEFKTVDETFKGIGLEDYIVINCPRSWASREIDKEVWDKIIDGLLKRYPVVQLGIEKDTKPTPRDKFYNLCGWYNLDQSRTIISKAKCYVGIDSGLFCLTQTTRTKAVGIFSCNDPELNVFRPESSEIVIPASECKYCINYKIKPPIEDMKCLKGDNECIKSITPDMVLNAVRRLI